MSKRSERRSQRKQLQTKQQWLIGGLVFAGLAVIAVAIGLFALQKPAEATPQANADDYSTIPVEVNYPAPDLALNNINGQAESLLDYRDKVLLVNNWATWCPPCKAEMPTLVAFYNDHAAQGLMIIAIEAGEAKEEVQKFVDQFRMPFQVWLDPQNDATNAFKNHSLPSSYVIDRTGTVRVMWTGQINRDMLEKYVTPLLDQN